MKLEQKQQIVEAARLYATEHGLSQNDLARKSGISAKYISDMFNGKTFTVANTATGKTVEIADKYYHKLADYVGLTLKKEYWKTVVTPQMQRILVSLQVAKENGETNIIIGETGCGKSYVCDLFRRKYPADTYIVTVSQTDNIGDIIEKMITALKINVSAKTRSGKVSEIIRYLADRRADGQEPQIIFDESEYMKQPALCAMKSLYDNLNRVCSIVLVGTDQLMMHLEQMKRKNKDGIPQFYRRVKFGVRRLEPIDRRFPGFLDDITDREIVRFLCENCDNYGELHDVLVPAMREADITGEPLTVDFIKTVLNWR
ncbi:MAG: AAA family ATPase [Bacteroidales bacterium]|nr:AAA family ATPase [Bacteroidales bacterium]